jgi:DNA polymerase III alpha subunit
METPTFSYNDENTWNLFKEGRTKGVFQLESNLGRAWSKRLQPTNIEELSALIALIRPGSLKAITDGKSMTQHYVDRKSGLDIIKYLHETLTGVLETTKGVLIYQEQSMRIAQELAGFNLQEADVLRKAIGKKKADLMAEVRKDFLAGCERVGQVDVETAQEIFGWIEKSSRYSFNKSHAVCYAINSYKSAWYKANHTKEFFLSYLTYANEKQDPHQEVYELVSEAKLFDIEVKLPNITMWDKTFFVNKNKIYFGIKDIKSLTGVNGDKTAKAIEVASLQVNRFPKEFNWMQILIYLSTKINATSFKALCSIGFFSTKRTGITRNKALYEYLIFKNLTKAELKWVTDNYEAKKWKTLKECFIDLAPTKKEGGGTSKVDRKQIIENEIHFLENPPYSLDDDPDWIIEQEKKYLGCPVSLSKVDSSDTSHSNTTCKEILDGKTGKNICIVANVSRLMEHTCKKGKSMGKKMCFLTLEDETCSIDNVVVFPETREKNSFILDEGVNLLFCGEVEKNGSFIINKIHEI